MDDDQIGALRDVIAAVIAYLIAPKDQAPARRADLCETMGQLLYALEGPLPDEDPDPEDDPPEPSAPVRLERFIDRGDQGGTVVPLRTRPPRRPKQPKGGAR